MKIARTYPEGHSIEGFYYDDKRVSLFDLKHGQLIIRDSHRYKQTDLLRVVSVERDWNATFQFVSPTGHVVEGSPEIVVQSPEFYWDNYSFYRARPIPRKRTMRKSVAEVWRKLSIRQKGLLIEAARRRIHFNNFDELITRQWTGLGTPSVYKPVVPRFMRCSNLFPTPKVRNWWQLTDEGAVIVEEIIRLCRKQLKEHENEVVMYILNP